MKLFAPCTFLVLSLTIFNMAEAYGACRQSNSRTTCDNGTTYTTHGDRMTGSDGSTYTRNGDYIRSSRGETYYQRDEDTVIGPGGTMYTKRGDTVHGPGGTVVRGLEDDNIFFRKEPEKVKDTWFEDHQREQDEKEAKQREADEQAAQEAQNKIDREQEAEDQKRRKAMLANMFGLNDPVTIDADGFYE